MGSAREAFPPAQVREQVQRERQVRAPCTPTRPRPDRGGAGCGVWGLAPRGPPQPAGLGPGAPVSAAETTPRDFRK